MGYFPHSAHLPWLGRRRGRWDPNGVRIAQKKSGHGLQAFFRFEDLSPESVSATLRMAKHWANSGVSYTHQR